MLVYLPFSTSAKGRHQKRSSASCSAGPIWGIGVEETKNAQGNQFRDCPFKGFGDIVNVEVFTKTRTATVEFSDYNPVDKCILKKEHIIEGYRCDVKKYLNKEQREEANTKKGAQSVHADEAKASSSSVKSVDQISVNEKSKILKIQGIRKTDTEDDLKKYFQSLGKVVKVDIGQSKTRDPSGIACIHFEREIPFSKTFHEVDSRRFVILKSPFMEKKPKDRIHQQATGANCEAVVNVADARSRLKSLIHESISTTSQRRTPLGQSGSSSNNSEKSIQFMPKIQRFDSGVFESMPPRPKCSLLGQKEQQPTKPSLFDRDSYPLLESDDTVSKILAIRIIDTVKSKTGRVTPYYQALVQCSDGHKAKILTGELKKVEPTMLADVFEEMLADVYSGRFSFDKNGDEYVCN